MSQDSIVVVAAVRTPMGHFCGAFKNTTASTLGAKVIQAAIERAHLKPNDIDDVLMGCVLQAGQGQAPARQAALAAGLANKVPCTTINKMCGSGMKAIMLAVDEIHAGSATHVVAGGMENMSQAPYLLAKARFGYRIGHQTLYDHMMCDGLEDAYDKGKPMGYFAEQCALKHHFSRENQDQFAIESLHRAKKANSSGVFAAEIVAVNDQTQDENAMQATPEKIPVLKPVFKENGTITAANASSISDGAAAVILMRESEAKRLGITPLARIIGHHSVATEPACFTEAPVPAIQELCLKINWKIDSIDLFEINEAFAVVTMTAMKLLHLPHEKVNINGGACALGHPIGASGARIVVTLIHALRQKQLKRGIAAICIGGGEATAIAIERESSW